MATTDVAFAIYWILTAVGLVSVGGSAHIVAWNWSFLPLDALAIAAGLARAIMPKNHPASMPVLAAALALTHAADLLAISYFALTGPWDVTWWLVNLWLMLMPIGIAVSTIVVSLKTRRTRRLLVPRLPHADLPDGTDGRPGSLNDADSVTGNARTVVCHICQLA